MFPDKRSKFTDEDLLRIRSRGGATYQETQMLLNLVDELQQKVLYLEFENHRLESLLETPD